MHLTHLWKRIDMYIRSFYFTFYEKYMLVSSTSTGKIYWFEVFFFYRYLQCDACLLRTVISLNFSYKTSSPCRPKFIVKRDFHLHLSFSFRVPRHHLLPPFLSASFPRLSCGFPSHHQVGDMNRFLFCCVLLAIRTSLVRVLFLFFISIGVVIVLSSILVDACAASLLIVVVRHKN